MKTEKTGLAQGSGRGNFSLTNDSGNVISCTEDCDSGSSRVLDPDDF
jgi:hypothetical protein